MSRRYGKPDSNHAEICSALRAVGAFVVDLRAQGDGVPDLAVLFRAETYWLEVKSGRSAKNRKGATADRQREWRERAQECGVHVFVVTNSEEALRAIGVIK